MKLLIAVPAEGSVPLLEFFGLLDEKQRQKLLSLFALLLQSPAAVMREPYVKHFCIERYQALYELRAKSKNLVRIIFTLTDDGDILFLTPFIKRHKRNTMQALDRSLDCLTHIRDGSCSTQELSIKFFLNGGITVLYRGHGDGGAISGTGWYGRFSCCRSDLEHHLQPGPVNGDWRLRYL